MKKLLLLLLVAASFFANAQVTAEIISVETTTIGKIKGDLVTFTVSAPNNEVWGISSLVDYDGRRGHNGISAPGTASYTTQTYTIFAGYFGNLPKVRTYTIQVWFRPNPQYPTPEDFDAIIYSDPYTVSK